MLLCPPSRQDKHLRSHLPPLNASRSVLIKLSWNLRLERKTEVMSIPQNNVTEKNQMFDAGHPKPVLWDNPEGWGGEGDGRGVQDIGTHEYPWPIHVDVWQKPS